MFVGEYTHSIDDKGRLTIPAKFRDSLREGLFVSRGFGRNLAVYTPDEWKILMDRMNQQSLTGKSMRKLRHRIVGGAADLTPDRQGRILIPAHLREFAQLKGEVVLVGMDNAVEIWSRESWQIRLQEIEADLDAELDALEF